VINCFTFDGTAFFEDFGLRAAGDEKLECGKLLLGHLNCLDELFDYFRALIVALNFVECINNDHQWLC
jgi:hypothetical protein